MSIKKTISTDENCHLYSYSSDEDNIYMELKDMSECCFELWEIADGTKNSSVRVKIPIKSWKRIVKNWNRQNKRLSKMEKEK